MEETVQLARERCSMRERRSTDAQHVGAHHRDASQGSGGCAPGARQPLPALRHSQRFTTPHRGAKEQALGCERGPRGRGSGPSPATPAINPEYVSLSASEP